MTNTATRRWEPVLEVLGTNPVQADEGDPDGFLRLERFLERAWPHLKETGVSWIGFYLDTPDDDLQELTLGPSRGGPACSPIGLHGACGKAFLENAPLVVRDVAELGADYIACDPRDRSELVVPIRGKNGLVGVLALDSHAIGAFDEQDARWLQQALALAGLGDPPTAE